MLPELIATVEGFRSSLRDDILPAVAIDPGAKAREEALLWMVGAGVRAEPAQRTSVLLELRTWDPGDLRVASDAACLALSEAGRKATVPAAVPSGTRIRLVATTTSSVVPSLV